jgi:hypothetical protein
MTGSFFSGRYSDYVLKKLVETKGEENVYPELRLRAGFPSFILLPAGLLIYGWTTEKRVGVYAPFIGLFIAACGQMWGSTPTSVYLVDSKPGRSASALAINNFVRYIVVSIVTIFSTSGVRALGNGVLFTIIAGVNIANIGLVLLVLVYGKKWRTNFEKSLVTGHKQ